MEHDHGNMNKTSQICPPDRNAQSARSFAAAGTVFGLVMVSIDHGKGPERQPTRQVKRNHLGQRLQGSIRQWTSAFVACTSASTYESVPVARCWDCKVSTRKCTSFRRS